MHDFETNRLDPVLTGADPLRAELAYDPRFMLFEFSWTILLRRAQIALVREIVGKVSRGEPVVKQMLMGGGKTTVVGPLLTLILGDGARRS